MTTTAEMVVFHGSVSSYLERHATSALLLLASDPAAPHVIHRATERRQTLVGVKTGGGY
jgi:hypothetical protein